MGHTDAPETFRGLFKQRLRWDGDLYYLYIRKHPMAFNPRQLGWRNLIMQLWTGLFFQLVMPFVLILYTIYIFVVYPVGFVLAVCVLIYFLYFGITIFFYFLYLILLSERPLDDIRLAWIIPFIPFYAFSLRVWNAISTLLEMFANAHMDSTMAPWWVLRKTKF